MVADLDGPVLEAAEGDAVVLAAGGVDVYAVEAVFGVALQWCYYEVDGSAAAALQRVHCDSAAAGSLTRLGVEGWPLRIKVDIQLT